MLDSSTHHHSNFHTKLRHSTPNRLLAQEASVAAEVDQVILVSRTGAKAMAEDGDSSQEEVDEETPRTDQEVQEDLEEEAAAVEDQATLWDLELRQTLASDPHPSGILLWKQS